MNFSESVNYLFNEVSVAYRTLLEKKLNEIELHSGQVFILFSLWSEDNQPQNSLAKALHLSSPTINKMVKSLQTSGFVSTAKCGEDGRAVRVTLTEKGTAIRPAVERIWDELEREIYSNLTDTEKIILVQLLKKTRDNILIES